MEQIEITDKDINWVETLLGIKFDDERRTVIKNLDECDIQAFPGSGKTTCLIAKLAILAEKWPYSNRGICVLSHTNVAKEEIENRLGNTSAGKKLLSYPHFIGTVHSFFDTYVALPWLKSHAVSINMIDSENVQLARWYMLKRGTRTYFEINHKDYHICQYIDENNSINWNKNGSTKEELLNVIELSRTAGNYTFDEMMYISKKVLQDVPEISMNIGKRFPFVFIDEAQDTNLLQWELIHLAFPENQQTIIQGFGDINQAIYNYVNESSADIFPRKNPLVISSSRRFDQRIANFANNVAVSKEEMIGTENELTSKCVSHTVFLFSKEKAHAVIDEYSKKILNTFSDEELLQYKNVGCHVVGMVHDKKEETKPEHFPKGIYDYWCGYEARHSNKNYMPNSMIEYCQRARNTLAVSNEYSDYFDVLLRGLRCLINKAASQNIISYFGSINAFVGKFSDTEKVEFRTLLMQIRDIKELSEENWFEAIGIFKQILEMYSLQSNQAVDDFLKWKDLRMFATHSDENNKNVYTYIDENNGRRVDIEFGSIHSVKGRTHLATLVVETFTRAGNMQSIIKYICGEHSKIKSNNLVRLKCQYVAMTRARGLLCLALPIESVDDGTIVKLQKIGWQVSIIK